MTSRANARPASTDDRLDLLFGALSDRTRRALLTRLARAPAGVTELAEPFDMSLPAVSKHVKVLERAGLVKRSIDGRVHVCTARVEPLYEVERWLVDTRAFWEGALDSLTDYVAAEKPAKPARKRRV